MKDLRVEGSRNCAVLRRTSLVLTKQEHSETANLRQGDESSLDPESVSAFGLLPKLDVDSLVQGHIYGGKIFMNIRALSSEIYKPNCGKMPYLAMLKNPLKIHGFGSGDG